MEDRPAQNGVSRAYHSTSHAAEATRTLSSRNLLGADNSVLIEHEGAHYQLRATRTGKLILTK